MSQVGGNLRIILNDAQKETLLQIEKGVYKDRGVFYSLVEDCQPINNRSVKALIDRKLIDSNLILTDLGKIACQAVKANRETENYDF